SFGPTVLIGLADADPIRRRPDHQPDGRLGSCADELESSVASRSGKHAEVGRERENPALAAFGSAFALTLANSLIDKMVTPEGLTALIQGARGSAYTEDLTRNERGRQNERYNNAATERVKFAFFVSPIHFQIDLREPDRGRSSEW